MEMLVHLSDRRQTGAVVARRGEEAAVVYLRDGKIVGANGPWAVVADQSPGPESVTRTVQQVLGWERYELRFHAQVQPRRSQLSFGVEIWQVLRGFLPEGAGAAAREPIQPPADPAVESGLAELFDQLPPLVLWATIKYPNKPLLALLEAVQIALSRLLAQHRAYHTARQSPASPGADDGKAGGDAEREPAAMPVSSRHLELGLTEAHRSLQRRFPALAAVGVTDGRLDMDDLLPTYDLLSGPARAAFYAEVVAGLIALAGVALDNLVKCEMHGRPPAPHVLAGWRTFMAEIERRLEAAKA
ncbi:MAG: DUF4388 domain-containing protein [Chloroflexi bacterium]|nr:DUF4388 domain-containing protein [Chloroflexota bacterium]